MTRLQHIGDSRRSLSAIYSGHSVGTGSAGGGIIGRTEAAAEAASTDGDPLILTCIPSDHKAGTEQSSPAKDPEACSTIVPGVPSVGHVDEVYVGLDVPAEHLVVCRLSFVDHRL